MIPVLNRLLDAEAGLKCIYFAPLKSLINDIASRLEVMLSPFGLFVGKWHGDLSRWDKESALKNSSILVTTPESVEGILSGSNACLFENIEFIIIDEVHAFIESPRGAQLVSILERLRVLSQADPQRIAMSATVGNPDRMMKWLSGSSERRGVIVAEDKKVSRSIEVFTDGEIEPVDYLLKLLKGTGEKILVFSYSRSKAEEFAAIAKSLGLNVPVHHSSVSKSQRGQIEDEFKNNSDLRAVVATSTLEMGIDIGDIDRVVFLELPSSAASFLQRAGRSGRKKGKSKITVFVNDSQSCYNLLGILKKLDENTVEPVEPIDFYPQLLAHQLIGLSYWRGLLSAGDLDFLKRAFPFTRVGRDHFKMLVDHLIEREFLTERDGMIVPGASAAEIFGSGRSKMDFVVLVPGSLEYSVVLSGEEIGRIHPLILNGQEGEGGENSFILGGKSYLVREIDRKERVVHVVPGRGGRLPGWLGGSSAVTKSFARSIMNAMIDLPDYEETLLSEGTHKRLEEISRDVVADGRIRLISEKEGNTVITYAGDMSNIFLVTCLKAVFGVERTSSNWRDVKIKDKLGTEELADMLLALAKMDHSELKTFLSLFLMGEPGRLRKMYDLFGDKLYDYAPENLIAEFVVRNIFDPGLLKELEDVDCQLI